MAGQTAASCPGVSVMTERSFDTPWSTFSLRGALANRLSGARHRQLKPGERAIFFAALVWLPLALLCILDGPAKVEAFKRDLATHARYLLALPGLLFLDRVLGDLIKDDFGRMALLVTQPAREAYSKLVQRTAALLVSWKLEFALLLGGYALVAAVGPAGVGKVPTPWIAGAHPGELSGAGLYQLAFGLPFFFFVCFRWLARYAIWLWFLGKASRLQLKLVHTDADHAGGLGFVGRTQVWFSLVFISLEIVAAARWASLVLWHGLNPTDLAVQFAVLLLIVAVLFTSPALLFVGPLWRLRYDVLPRFDAFGSGVSQGFEKNWLRGADPAKALENDEISQLCDLHTIHDSVHRTRLTVFSLPQVIQLFGYALIPACVPFAVSVPLVDILKALAGAIF